MLPYPTDTVVRAGMMGVVPVTHRSPPGGLMAARTSAGLLIHRLVPHPEVLIAHPGGPFFSRRDAGGWTIPKGELKPGESPLEAARREFIEETGLQPPPGEPVSLDAVMQLGGKVVRAWTLSGDLDLSGFHSNTFSLVWPSRSGIVQEFPEIDRIIWADLDLAREKLLASQVPFLDRLEEHLATHP